MTVRQDGMAGSFNKIVAQGELAVGAATVQLLAASTPCSCIWLGAPTADHTVGAANTSNVLVGKESGGNKSGGIPVETDNALGFYYPVANANMLFLTGFTAGDRIEYQVYE